MQPIEAKDGVAPERLVAEAELEMERLARQRLGRQGYLGRDPKPPLARRRIIVGDPLESDREPGFASLIPRRVTKLDGRQMLLELLDTNLRKTAREPCCRRLRQEHVERPADLSYASRMR